MLGKMSRRGKEEHEKEELWEDRARWRDLLSDDPLKVEMSWEEELVFIIQSDTYYKNVHGLHVAHVLCAENPGLNT
jgi:hypothetical protein